jgi:hypothetical protein
MRTCTAQHRLSQCSLITSEPIDCRRELLDITSNRDIWIPTEILQPLNILWKFIVQASTFSGQPVRRWTRNCQKYEPTAFYPRNITGAHYCQKPCQYQCHIDPGSRDFQPFHYFKSVAFIILHKARRSRDRRIERSTSSTRPRVIGLGVPGGSGGLVQDFWIKQELIGPGAINSKTRVTCPGGIMFNCKCKCNDIEEEILIKCNLSWL